MGYIRKLLIAVKVVQNNKTFEKFKIWEINKKKAKKYNNFVMLI